MTDIIRKSAIVPDWWSENVTLTLDCIIFDIDGTVADVRHRRKYVDGPNKDWKSWNANMHLDPPHIDVCFLAELLGDHPLVNNGSIKLFLFSGRGEEKRVVTEEWLLKYIRPYFQKAELLMRAEGDYRSDIILKREMLQSIRERGYGPRIVVDDRPSVCAMWREEGLTVLEHNTGEWNESLVEWGSGRFIILVGPSGGGKSTYAAEKWYPHQIVSSDELRQEICGDFRDQSKDNQVFYALHKLVKARIDSGLTTVVDATNLRPRDRKALRDLVPFDGNIYYHIIDRPLDDKHRDADWRDEVVINGMKLIDKHHRTFQQGFKAIRRGDDDKRVTVIDARTTGSTAPQ